MLLVVDAMTGQDAVNVAEQFAEVAQFDGVILSKLDGDARGGAALAVKAVTGKPILFASTGEKLGDFESFHPDRMAQRILGMGDVLSFIEKAEQQVDEDEAKELERKLRKNQFTLEDFLDQLKKIRSMGPLTSLLGMIPGLAGHQLSKMNVDEKELDRVEAIVLSMTPYERRHPELIKGSRRLRIAKGSGTTVQQVNQLVKQFDQMRKMMRGIQQGKMPDLGQLMRAALKRSAILPRRYGSQHATHPRRREERPPVAGGRRRPPLPAGRPVHRDDRAVQPADRSVDHRAQRGADPLLALQGRPALRAGPEAPQDAGHPPASAPCASCSSTSRGCSSTTPKGEGRGVRGGRRHARARALGGR